MTLNMMIVPILFSIQISTCPSHLPLYCNGSTWQWCEVIARTEDPLKLTLGSELTCLSRELPSESSTIVHSLGSCSFLKGPDLKSAPTRGDSLPSAQGHLTANIPILTQPTLAQTQLIIAPLTLTRCQIVVNGDLQWRWQLSATQFETYLVSLVLPLKDLGHKIVPAGASLFPFPTFSFRSSVRDKALHKTSLHNSPPYHIITYYGWW